MARHDDEALQRRLRADAGDIRAELSPEMRARIAASLQAVRELPPLRVARETAVGSPASNWWASGLTGVAAALLIILLINRNSNELVEAPAAEVATTVTPEIAERFGSLPLKATTAELTGPLEEELEHLQSDLEKARQKVERDLRLTF